MSLIKNKPVNRGIFEPEVVIIIPAHNEEKKIGAKIENCIAYDYPADKIKIVVASDKSTDRTEETVKKFESDQVYFMPLPFRGGKVAAQNYAVQFFDSEIFIFTDVAILTEPQALSLILQNFNDSDIGVVSCRDSITGEQRTTDGETSYIRYDMMVRKYTSQIGSIIGVTGGFYAVRKEIVKGGWNPAFPPDFYVALRSIKRGFRVVEDPRIKAYYKTAAKEWDELPRKVRTLNRGMHALLSYSNRNLLNPIEAGFISIQLLSHKLLRWLTPFLFATLFLSNVFILKKMPITALFLFPQLVLYILIVCTFVDRKLTRKGILFKLSSYFGITNVAILMAWYELISGKKYLIWKPTKR